MTIKFIFLLLCMFLDPSIVFSASLHDVLLDKGNSNLYRKIVLNAAKRQHELDEATLEAGRLATQRKFIQARRKILGIYESPEAKKRRRKLKSSKVSQVHPCDCSVQPPRTKNFSKAVANLVCRQSSNSSKNLADKDLSEAILAKISGFASNPPFYRLAMKAIKSQPTFEEQCRATTIWSNLFRIPEPNFLAAAVTDVLKAKSLKTQSIIGNTWQGFFVKIKDPELRFRVIGNVLGKRIKDIEAVSGAWRTLLIGDSSLIGRKTSIPDYVLSEMETLITPEDMKVYAKSWQKFRTM